MPEIVEYTLLPNRNVSVTAAAEARRAVHHNSVRKWSPTRRVEKPSPSIRLASSCHFSTGDEPAPPRTPKRKVLFARSDIRASHSSTSLSTTVRQSQARPFRPPRLTDARSSSSKRRRSCGALTHGRRSGRHHPARFSLEEIGHLLRNRPQPPVHHPSRCAIGNVSCPATCQPASYRRDQASPPFESAGSGYPA